jgi:hypothetical protein
LPLRDMGIKTPDRGEEPRQPPAVDSSPTHTALLSCRTLSCRPSGLPATCYVRGNDVCLQSQQTAPYTSTSTRAHAAAGTPTWPWNGGQSRPARSVPASLERWALQAEILPHGSGLTMDTGRGRPPAVTHSLDRIESDGRGGSGLLLPGRKHLSTLSPCPSRAYPSSTLAGLCVARRRDRNEPCVRDSDEKARRRQVAAAPAVALSTGSPRERSPC